YFEPQKTPPASSAVAASPFPNTVSLEHPKGTAPKASTDKTPSLDRSFISYLDSYPDEWSFRGNPSTRSRFRPQGRPIEMPLTACISRRPDDPSALLPSSELDDLDAD